MTRASRTARRRIRQDRVRVRRFGTRWVCLALLSIGLGVLPVAFRDAGAATYRCEDSAGVTVLTDSPAQLRHCSLLFPDAKLAPAPEPPEGGSSRNTSAFRSGERYRETREMDRRSSPRDEAGGRTPSSTSDQEALAIPVTMAGGSVMVPVLLDGKRRAQLILDTGATMTVLSTEIAVELALLSGSRNRVTTIETAGGPVQVTIGRLDSVQVGPAVARNVLVAIHDIPRGESGIDGLLGMSFLRHFLVTLDADHGRLYLRPRRDSSTSP